MRILVATPFMSQHFDAGLFWVKALCQLGHSVVMWDYRIQSNEPVDWAIGNDSLGVIVMKGETIPDRWIKFWSRRAPTMVYWPDALERTPGIEEKLREYHKVFTPVRPTPPWMNWLPTGWDPEIHKGYNQPRIIDTAYIGTNNSSYKRQMIHDIKPRAVYGNNWRGDSYVDELDAYPPVYLHELVGIASATKVLIDVHQSPHVGLNRKFFECIACGFTLVDRVPGVEDILGKELADAVSFSHVEDAKGKVNYYLKHEEKREELWKRELEAIEGHTYLNSAKRILDSME